MTQKLRAGFNPADLHIPEELEMYITARTEITRFTPAALDLVKLAPRFSDAVDRFDAAVRIDRASALTPVIDTHHDKLVQTYAGLSAAVTAVELSLASDTAAEGKILRRVLDMYPVNKRINYEEAADNAHNLLADLAAAPADDLVAKNSLGSWTSAMSAILASYRKLVADRLEQIGSLPVGETVAARLQCRHYWRTLIERVNSQIFDGAELSAPFVTFVSALKELIHRYKIVANSPGHGHHGGGDGGSGGGRRRRDPSGRVG